jgi:hypothetical protein
MEDLPGLGGESAWDNLTSTRNPWKDHMQLKNNQHIVC